MFDIGWVEIAFVGALALVVVGPKELPQFIHGAGRAIARMRRIYRDSLASMQQLEQEIRVASAPPPRNQGEPDYYALLPDHVLETLRNGQAEPLRDAAAHAQREREIAAALAEAQNAHASRDQQAPDPIRPT